ncbi:MAG: hypothetical protein ACHQM6_05775 [Candidatus Kapaibacterium sp.]
MRYKFGLIILVGLFFGCEKSEKLNDDEMHYIFTTLALTKARVASHDSVQLGIKLDSVYKKFGTSEADYKKQTLGFAKIPDRAGIIYRAIADSMNMK